MLSKNTFFYTTIALFTANLISAQVKIGNNVTNVQTGQLLQLEKDGTNGGLKIAEAALTSATDRTTITIPTDAYGTLIWNTGSAGLTPAGFYMWDGSEWKKVLAGKFPNIYNENGIVDTNRTVDLDVNTIAFPSKSTTGTSHFTVDGTTLNVNATDNKVGIRNNNPKEALDVNGDVIINGLTSPRTAQVFADEQGKLIRGGDFTKPFLIGELRSSRVMIFDFRSRSRSDIPVMTGKRAINKGLIPGASAYETAFPREKVKFITINGLRMDFLYNTQEYLRPKLYNTTGLDITYTINTVSPVDNYTTGGNTVVAPNHHCFMIDDIIYASDARTETVYCDINFPNGEWYRITYSAQRDDTNEHHLYFSALRLN